MVRPFTYTATPHARHIRGHCRARGTRNDLRKLRCPLFAPASSITAEQPPHPEPEQRTNGQHLPGERERRRPRCRGARSRGADLVRTVTHRVAAHTGNAERGCALRSTHTARPVDAYGAGISGKGRVALAGPTVAEPRLRRRVARSVFVRTATIGVEDTGERLTCDPVAGGEQNCNGAGNGERGQHCPHLRSPRFTHTPHAPSPGSGYPDGVLSLRRARAFSIYPQRTGLVQDHRKNRLSPQGGSAMQRQPQSRQQEGLPHPRIPMPHPQRTLVLVQRLAATPVLPKQIVAEHPEPLFRDLAA